MGFEKAIKEIQEEIAALDPKGHYSSTYRFEEAGNWGEIPSWVQTDFIMKEPVMLDIGAAYGTLAIFCKKVLKAHIRIIDRVNYYFLLSLRDQYGIEFHLIDIEREAIPWKKTFDAIILTEVIEHFNFNPLRTLAKINDALKPDAFLYLSTPERGNQQKGKGEYDRWTEIPEYTEESKDLPHVDKHIHEYHPDELINLLSVAHFMCVRIRRTQVGKRRRIQITAQKTCGKEDEEDG